MKKSPPAQAVLSTMPVAKQHFSFSGHETFVFRYGWLKKAVDAVAADPGIFSKESAIVTLGVGKNMVQSIRHWGRATQVLAEVPGSRGQAFAVSEFGQFIFGEGGKDPYLEDPNTLWLLHWNLLSQAQRATTWQWTFDKLPSNEFTRESLFEFVQNEARQLGVAVPTENTLKRDIEVFVRTYAPSRAAKSSVVEDTMDCPFVELQLLEQTAQPGHYRLLRGHKTTLSDFAFAYCLTDFWDRTAPNQETLALSEIAYKPGGPGSVFKLDENSLIESLERLDDITEGKLTYSESAGLRQVYRRRGHSSVETLAHYYDDAYIPAGVGV